MREIRSLAIANISFSFRVTTFEPIIIYASQETQNDCLNLIFCNLFNVIGKKMTRKLMSSKF